MESSEWIRGLLVAGSVAGAIAAIAALTVRTVRAVRRAIRYFTDLRASVDTLVKHDRTQYLSILRLTVMAENIPLSERIAAGKEYIEAGGNGDVRHFYETALKPYDALPRS